MSDIFLPDINKSSIAVIGLGYVGLPLALRIAKNNTCLLSKKKLERFVIGYDINKRRIEELEKGIDRNKIFSIEKIQKVKNIKFLSDKNLEFSHKTLTELLICLTVTLIDFSGKRL